MVHYQIEKETDRLWMKESVSPEFELKTESVFAQCNGYMGIRAAQPLKTIEEQRGMFISGVFNKAYEDEVTELVNCPDLTWFELEVDGQKIVPERSAMVSAERKLDLTSGELQIEYVFTLDDGTIIAIENKRFASFENKNLFVQKLAVSVLEGRVKTVKVKTGINGQQTNSGVSHFKSATARVYDKQIMEIRSELEDNTVTIAADCVVKAGTLVKKDFVLGRRKITGVYEIQMEDSSALVFEKIAHVDQTEDGMSTAKRNKSVAQAAAKGYDLLLDGHRALLAEYWNQVSVEVEGMSLEDEAAVKFAQYHILGMTPWHTNSSSIAAKGLTGEGYKGHVFWDTEIFILPSLLYTYPEEARRLLEFRYKGLQGARNKAKEYGYKGAMFPWEAAKSGEEETPLYAALNIHTGKANKVWSGIKEYHVTADIMYAMEQYYQVTNDLDFMECYGYEMAIETARFWVSAAKWDENRQKYGIYDIIGPDEYTEHIDNNAYTNHMVVYCVKKAIQYLEDLKQQNPQVYHVLNDRLAFEAELEEWKDFTEKMYLPEPNAEGIIPQDDTFLSKKCLENIEKYKTSQVKQAVLMDYSREEVVNMQVLKQADVVMLLNLFPQMFAEEIVKKNVLFYESRTIHDSSLSYCAHAQACAAIGAMDLSWEFFRHCLMIDIDDNPHDSMDGIHSASLGGIWNCLIFGFAGVNYQDQTLYLNPNVPGEWKKMSFRLVIDGVLLKFEVSNDLIRLTSEDPMEHEIHVRVGQKDYTFKNEIEIKLT